VPEDLLQLLTRFHREVVMPDLDRREESYAKAEQLREMTGHLDAIYYRFDRLETEYQALVGGLRRVEEQLAAVNERLHGLEKGFGSADRDDVRHYLDEIKANVAALQKRIAELEATL
jgi:hypothetical protein